MEGYWWSGLLECNCATSQQEVLNFSHVFIWKKCYGRRYHGAIIDSKNKITVDPTEIASASCLKPHVQAYNRVGVVQSSVVYWLAFAALVSLKSGFGNVPSILNDHGI
ncbi:hypothetical protein DITRI_Ditri10aG0120600 [Diplodiscus trichospermus]